MNLRHVKRQELKLYILQMFDALKRKYGKKYCRPPLKTMVKLLVQNPKIQTSTRTISRAIREMVDDHEIYRKNRHKRGKGIKMLCRATAYYILDKGFEIFRKMLRQAQRFLRPLGEPNLASDKVPLERVFNKFSAQGVEILLKSVIKGRASPV
jgi:hypothetical protein